MQLAKKFTSNNDLLNFASDLSIKVDTDSSPANRFEGFTFETFSMSQDDNQGGEMHPDGDEVVLVISGIIVVSLEFEEDQVVVVNAGEGIIIPKGIWHRVQVLEPVQLATISPGPNFEFREPIAECTVESRTVDD